MNLEHSIKVESHERYPVHLKCLRNIKKIKYPDFQAMTISKWSLKLSFFILCQLAVVVPCLSDISTSDLQHTSGSSVHFWLISAVLLHDPI